MVVLTLFCFLILSFYIFLSWASFFLEASICFLRASWANVMALVVSGTGPRDIFLGPLLLIFEASIC
jgi:hypothetical protein